MTSLITQKYLYGAYLQIIRLECHNTKLYFHFRKLNKVKKITKGKKTIVILDSNHSHEHVLKEIEMYSGLIRKNGYLIVMDTAIEFVKKKHVNKGRDFGPGNSPFTAIKEFLKINSNFKVDKLYENKAIITSAIGGFLKKIN